MIPTDLNEAYPTMPVTHQHHGQLLHIVITQVEIKEVILATMADHHILATRTSSNTFAVMKF